MTGLFSWATQDFAFFVLTSESFTAEWFEWFVLILGNTYTCFQIIFIPLCFSFLHFEICMCGLQIMIFLHFLTQEPTKLSST